MRTRVHENQLTGTLTIEADTPAAALSEAAARLGPDAQIEAAQRVSRGGVAGFFARERFQVRARAEGRTDDGAIPWGGGEPFDIAETPLFDDVDRVDTAESFMESPPPQQVQASQSFGSALEAALMVGAEEQAESRRVAESEILARVAREDEIRAAAVAVASEPAPQRVGPNQEVEIMLKESTETVSLVPPPPPPPPPPPTARTAGVQQTPAPERRDDQAPAWRLQGPAEPIAPGLGRVNWGRSSLVRLGLPTTLIDAVADIDVRDDLGWINTIADVVAPLCRPLPTGPVVVVGAGVERIASRLGLGFVRPRDEVNPEGSLCATVADTPADIEWLQRMKGDRGIHLVIADSPWMHLLVDDPTAVSYVTDQGVVDALYVALTLGVPLGYGTVDGSRRLSRIDAIDVALTVRRLVGRQ